MLHVCDNNSVVEQAIIIDCQIHGFDMSTAHFPSVSSLPGNVFLHQQNILEPYPAEFLGLFDVVRVRLITLGLRGDDWDKAMGNMVTLLSPSLALR